LSFKQQYYVTRIIYEKIIGEQISRLSELQDPRVVYVTDLVLCTHKFHLKKIYPWLSVTFEPITILGTIAHLGLGKLLSEKGIETEVEVSRDVIIGEVSYLIKGRVDALDRNNSIVIEIKTAKSTINSPREHHVKQLNIYLNLLNYEKGVLVYITPSKIVEFNISREPVDFEHEIKDLIEDKHHPKYSWECNYCHFSKLCPYHVESK